MPKSVLAIDPGTRRTGFAITDPLRITCEPLEVFHGPEDEIADHVATLLDDRDVGTFVVGLPLNMDGTESARSTAVRALAKRLAERFPSVTIDLRDERLTTKEAEDLLRQAGHHGKHRKARRDSWSAMVLLREWMSAEGA